MTTVAEHIADDPGARPRIDADQARVLPAGRRTVRSTSTKAVTSGATATAEMDVDTPSTRTEARIPAGSRPGSGGAVTKRRMIILMGVTALVAGRGGFELGRVQASEAGPVAPTPAAAAPQATPDGVDVAPAALHNMNLQFATAEVRPLVRTVRTTGLIAFNE